MFEIGVAEGGSVEMWRRYFGPYAQIVGIDINPDCKKLERDQISIRIGDQADAAFLDQLIEEFGHPDVVIDDGSHRMSDISKTFEFLYPKVSPNGVYFVEDLHTCYWPEYEVGLHKPESFIELTKRLIDELNAMHTRGAVLKTEFSRTTIGIHFYDSCIAFERGRDVLKRHLRTGG
jgi:hypothetical protein